MIFVGLVVIAVAGYLLVRDDSQATPTVIIITGGTPTSADAITPSPAQSAPADATAAATLTPGSASSPQAEATATATAGPTATPVPVGAGRSNPIPFGESGISQDGEWELQVLDVIRGEEAWNQVSAANQFNEPPPPGMEYVMMNVRVKYTGTSAEEQIINTTVFQSTGDAGVRWPNPFVVTPAPELSAEVFSGGEATGWVVLEAREGEGNLMAIFDAFLSFEEGDEVYIALQAGAMMPIVEGRQAAPNQLGVDRLNPAPFGEHVITDIWELWVSEVIRGDEAQQRISDAFEFNEAPPEGQEFIMAFVHAHNVQGGASTEEITTFSFASTGANSIIYDHVFVVEPEPPLAYAVYPGGEAAGWVVVVADIGETDMALVFNDLYFSGDTRYLALTE